MTIHQISSLRDNYIYILREGNQTLVIDPSTFEDVDRFLVQHNWSCDFILNTHHHYDHVGGNKKLKEKYGAKIVGPFYDRERIPGMDIELKEGDIFSFNHHRAKILFLPGHTKGHIAYWFRDLNFLFCGDTLFLMGCGRLFEGSPFEMCESLSKIQSLPEDTLVYCAHEYTLENGKFALEMEPENKDLQYRLSVVREKRKKNLSTVPGLLKEELRTNPFLRLDSLLIRKKLNLEDASYLEVFKKMRALKDIF